MAWCVPLPSPIPRCHICCAKGAASQSQRRPLPLRGVGALAGISAGHFVLRFDGGIHPLRWYAAGPGLSGVGAGPGPRFWRVRIAGRGCHRAVTRTPSGKRYTGHSLRAQYQKILSARALRSASPAIATRQAAITILPKPAPLKAPRGSRQPASPGRAVGVAKPWWLGSLAVSAVAGVLASAESG